MPAAPHSPVLVWFRQDLRLSDNPALTAAVASGRPIIPVFILEPEALPGGASQWWLHGSLAELRQSLAAAGNALLLRRGDAQSIIPQLIDETGASAIFWNRLYDPRSIARDSALKSALQARGVDVQSFNGSLLMEPWHLATKTGDRYKVFTPFWNALAAQLPNDAPLAAPKKIKAHAQPRGETLESWNLRPTKPDWASAFANRWQPGEQGAQQRLYAFLGASAAHYKDQRDMPGIDGTSRLSPHLHWGDISPRQVLSASRMALAQNPDAAKGIDAFLRELGWRDFALHLVYHWPEMLTQAWKADYAAFPWHNDAKGLRAWQKGLTGYPIVDAGMRELWQTGFMHNRVRMIAASFLIKDLLIDWREGAAWFEDTLVDADLAVNRASWQWVAGSGADAAPYFRIFNPVLQGEKFDPDGAYVRRYVPELARLDPRFIHRPWEAPLLVLREAGITLGKTYPERLIDHGVARDRALAALKALTA